MNKYQEALDLLSNTFKDNLISFDDTEKEAVEILQELVDKVNEWIPVEERLPKEHEIVLVTYLEYISNTKQLCEIAYINEYRTWSWYFNGTVVRNKIIAWMPLPESYKGSDEDVRQKNNQLNEFLYHFENEFCRRANNEKCTNDCKCYLYNEQGGFICLLDVIEMLMKKSKYFNKSDQTLDFKHFKLYSENTLKNMNKDDLINYIHMLYRNWSSCDKTCQNLINHTKKLSDSNDELRKQLYFCEPYRFEDLKKGMWVWDEDIGACMFVKEVNRKINIFTLVGGESFLLETVNITVKFEENRFFPLIKAMEYQGKAGDEE